MAKVFVFPIAGFPNAAVVTSKLSDEIISSTIKASLVGGGVASDDTNVTATFSLDLDGDDVVALNDVMNAHDGIPIPSNAVDPRNGYRVVAVSPYAYSEQQSVHQGVFFTLTRGMLNFGDILIERTSFVKAARYKLKGASEGDTVEFSAVDKDDVLGMFSMLGLVVGVDVLEVTKFVRDVWMNAGDTDGEIRSDSAGQIPAGLYLRVKYDSLDLPPGEPATSLTLNIVYHWFEE